MKLVGLDEFLAELDPTDGVSDFVEGWRINANAHHIWYNCEIETQAFRTEILINRLETRRCSGTQAKACLKIAKLHYWNIFQQEQKLWEIIASFISLHGKHQENTQFIFGWYHYMEL